MSEQLPQFVRDLFASPPKRGDGLNLWFFRVARVLHPFREQDEIINLLQAATAANQSSVVRSNAPSRAASHVRGNLANPFARTNTFHRGPKSTRNGATRSFSLAANYTICGKIRRFASKITPRTPKI